MKITTYVQGVPVGSYSPGADLYVIPLHTEGTRTHRSVYHALAVSPYAVAGRQPNRCAEACVNAARFAAGSRAP